MRYTGKAIGLLSAQYRSILKKCFLINCGIFALMEADYAVAAFSPTLGEKSAYEVSVGSATDYNFLVTDGTEKSYWKINFNTDNLEGEHTNVSDSSTEATGSVSVILPNNASQTTLYYTYTKPSLYQQTSTRITSITTDNVTNKLFQNAYISGAQGGAIYNTSDKSSVSIISDFVGNHNRSAYGGAIYNSGKIGSITGDFIKNYTESSSSEARGGVISNFGTITEIIGDFIGNGSQSTNSYSDAGAIYNRDANAKIESIKGNFIGNYSIGRTAASGGIMWNNGSIGSIAGNFVGNYAKSSGYGNYEARGGVFSANNGTIGSITGDF
ncbi:MAG: hypothetical protein IKO06_05100, partial [Alphaproteobacteria bacterium]|nr:hypothetical protein [Alphaproteobacteria bacterium]